MATGEVWLGLTVACCQCHSHKYDPLTQREFFGLYAFFDNLDEVDLSTTINGAEATILTLRDRTEPRDTFIHVRGDFRRRGVTVKPHTFGVLPELVLRGKTPDRLDLARWLVDDRHPLTARVAVNQIWKQLFGRGLVTTPNDFGTRGERPTHPELLDWLAVEFREQGWSRKQLIRQILSSQTWQQSSAHRPEIADRDPDNRLLARQNRFRLNGETLRDSALSAAGTLVSEIGGPSFRPPIPPDAGHGFESFWKPGEVRELNRRGLYILMQRTAPHPVLATLGTPDGITPCLERTRANTPLQSLMLMNDPMFFQCAQALGARVQTRPGTFADRLNALFDFTLGRQAQEQEQTLLKVLHTAAVAEFQATPRLAEQMLGDVGGDGTLVEQAAWVLLAQTVLNLDEFQTRE